LILPGFGGALLFQYYPFLTAFYRSFFSWDGRNAYWVGLNNFEFFISDPRLMIAWVNIGKLLVWNLFVTMTVPVMVAYLIFRLTNDRHRYIFRVLFVLPIVVPGFVNIILWRWFFANQGAINIVLRGVGLDAITRPWLGDPNTALYALMFMGFPWVSSVTMLIYLAGFLGIPKEVLDAAVVDGATGLKRFFKVELPLIRGQLKLQVVLTFIGTLQGFETVLIMTRGGPGFSTQVPGLRLYQAAILDADLGYACAIGTVLFVIIFGITMINQHFIKGSQALEQ